MAPRTIGFIVFRDFQILDMAGPMEAFSLSTRFGAEYRLQTLAPVAGFVRASNGLAVGPAQALADVSPEQFDTIAIVGGIGVWSQRDNEALLNWLASAKGRTRRICSVCSGAFLLAEAGLLDGRQAVTHWESVGELRTDFPEVDVVEDAIFCEDNGVWTSAGVTAGMDLALNLIEGDFGRSIALATAREMVVFLKRPGGQSQFSAELLAQQQANSRFDGLTSWIFANLGDDLDVQRLADQAGMSRRNFQRQFTQAFELTPAKFVERARIDAARRDLEEDRRTIDQIANHRGFGDPERMRRAFHRVLGVSPADYRDRFHKTGQAA